MQWPSNIDRNLELMALEVLHQVERTERLLEHPTDRLRSQVLRRDDYVDHLKRLIENASYAFLRRHGDIEKPTADLIRSVNVIVVNLERIGDHTVNIVDQTTYLSRRGYLNRFDYRPMFAEIAGALQLVPDAARNRDGGAAVKICEAEATLDDLYEQQLRSILGQMGRASDVRDLVTALFIFHYLERMGDALLNIGEAILFSKMGERLKYHQFRSVAAMMAESGEVEEAARELEVQGIWGTRSGCNVSKVSRGAAPPELQEVVYKEGARDKIQLERSKVEQWQELVPGLPPRIIQYEESGRDATLLVEYLAGHTLQEIVTSADAPCLESALDSLLATVRDVWRATQRSGPVEIDYVQQLMARLEDVFSVHPEFRGTTQRIGGLSLPSFLEQVGRSGYLDQELVAPVSVMGHGDFNLDNIIYNPDTGRVHYVDLHRSGRMDYVLDVSVFLVSSFRIPLFEPAVRERLQHVADRFFDFAQDFADEHGDEQFDARLALALARSFATSTRFEVNRRFAEDMLWRASYLLDRLNAHRGRPWSDFFLPREVLHD